LEADFPAQQKAQDLHATPSKKSDFALPAVFYLHVIFAAAA
jgi:hypothetical protein